MILFSSCQVCRAWGHWKNLWVESVGGMVTQSAFGGIYDLHIEQLIISDAVVPEDPVLEVFSFNGFGGVGQFDHLFFQLCRGILVII